MNDFDDVFSPKKKKGVGSGGLFNKEFNSVSSLICALFNCLIPKKLVAEHAGILNSSRFRTPFSVISVFD